MRRIEITPQEENVILTAAKPRKIVENLLKGNRSYEEIREILIDQGYQVSDITYETDDMHVVCTASFSVSIDRLPKNQILQTISSATQASKRITAQFSKVATQVSRLTTQTLRPVAFGENDPRSQVIETSMRDTKTKQVISWSVDPKTHKAL